MNLSFIVVVIFAVCTLSSPVSAAVVYLKNGDEIECQSYRRQGDRVYVRINRDTQIDFAVGDVDSAKTRVPPKKMKSSAATKPRATAKVTARSASEKAVRSDTFFGFPIPEGSTACTSELQKDLLARFDKYNSAAEAGNVNEWANHVIKYQAEKTKETLAGLDEKELQKRKKVLQEMAVKKYRATACMVSPKGETAVIAGRGTTVSQGKAGDAHGTILFAKEGQSWKVKGTVWNQSM